MVERKERKKISDLNDIPDGFFENNHLIERVDFEGLVFDGWRFSNTRLMSCEFVNCSFKECIFDDMDLQRTNLTKCTIKDCLFSKNFRFITGIIKDVKVTDSDFRSSFIQNVKWNDCIFDGADFRFIKAKSIDFSGSQFKQISFDGANIVRGRFKSIPGLNRSLFYNVKLDDCEFDWQEAFIIMEFGNERYDELYEYAIKPVLERYEISPCRVDQYEFHGRITDEILEKIITSQIVIAECSASNKNVYFEMGFSLGNNKKVILCIDEANNIPFDLKDYPFIVHGNKLKTLEGQLEQKLRLLIGIEDK